MARHHAFLGAKKSYREGLKAYQHGRYSEAEEFFGTARAVFVDLGEQSLAKSEQRSMLWARWNTFAAMKSLPGELFETLIRQAQELDEQELVLRARIAQLSQHRREGVVVTVEEMMRAADQAERQGLTELAGQCWSELAEMGTDLDWRAGAAVRAHELRGVGDKIGVYALYSVAVDAYGADRYDLAKRLALRVRNEAGSLQDALEELLSAIDAVVDEE